MSIALIATIPAYLAAAIALVLGADWMAAFAILVGFGVALALLLGLVATLCPARTDSSERPVTPI